jgi:D-lactate dehydrogenase (cytochrome)
MGLTATAIMLYNDKQRKEAEEVVHRMVKRAVEMEGTVTGEHGVGLVKRDYLNHELGETTVDAMRKVSSDLISYEPVLIMSSSSWRLILFAC